jgi:hypothetical protein
MNNLISENSCITPKNFSKREVPQVSEISQDVVKFNAK